MVENALGLALSLLKIERSLRCYQPFMASASGGIQRKGMSKFCSSNVSQHEDDIILQHREISSVDYSITWDNLTQYPDDLL